MIEYKNISILGCGWLGLIAGKLLVENGYRVFGSYHNENKVDVLKASGIMPVYVNVKHNHIECGHRDIWNSDIIMVAIPPKRVDGIEQIYPAMMQQVITELLKGSTRKVIFISSTSVYPENGQEVSEENFAAATKPSGKAVFEAEQVFLKHEALNTIVLRCGGLIGEGRLPGSFTRAAAFKTRGNVPVNLVTGRDVARAIVHLIQKDKWNEVLNVVSPDHPLRADLYSRAADLQGLEAPSFPENGNNKEYKIVSTAKLLATGFEYTTANLLAGLSQLYGKA